MNTTRENIICATVDLMLKSGYHAVSVDDICARANVKKGSFYHFFGSKTELTLQALEHRYQESKIICDDIFSSHFPPEERFHNFLEYIYKIQEDLYGRFGHVCGALTVTLGSEMACHDEIRGRAAGILSHYTKYYEHTLDDLLSSEGRQDDINAENAASNVNCYILGKVTIARIYNSLELLKDLETGVFQIAGLCSSKPKEGRLS